MCENMVKWDFFLFNFKIKGVGCNCFGIVLNLRDWLYVGRKVEYFFKLDADTYLLIQIQDNLVMLKVYKIWNVSREIKSNLHTVNVQNIVDYMREKKANAKMML